MLLSPEQNKKDRRRLRGEPVRGRSFQTQNRTMGSTGQREQGEGQGREKRPTPRRSIMTLQSIRDKEEFKEAEIVY